MNTYRIDEAYNTVYEYSDENECFLFYAKINMLTDEEMEIIRANEE